MFDLLPMHQIGLKPVFSSSCGGGVTSEISDFGSHNLASETPLYVDIKVSRTLDLSVSKALIFSVYTSTTWIKRCNN